MMTKLQAAQAKEVLSTIAAIQGVNYARIVRYNSTLNYLLHKKCNRVATYEMTNMLADLASVYGIDLDSTEYKKDLASILNCMGVPA